MDYRYIKMSFIFIMHQIHCSFHTGMEIRYSKEKKN